MKIKSVMAALTVTLLTGIMCGCATQNGNFDNSSEGEVAVKEFEDSNIHVETSETKLTAEEQPEVSSEKTSKEYEDLSVKEPDTSDEEEPVTESVSGPATLTYGYVEDIMGVGTVVKEVEICEGDYDTQIAFKTDKQIDDFTIYTVVMTGADEEGNPSFEETLYENLGTLKPDEYFLILLQFYGDTPEYAIEYTDADKTVKHLYLTQSGYDGAIMLTEY